MQKNNLKGRCFTIKNLTIKEENIYSKDASILLDKLSDSLQTITGNDGRQSFDLSDMKKQNSLFVIARNERQTPVGCGAYHPLAEGIAEIKRMYASFPHTGIGSAILCYLEKQAKETGYETIQLETRKNNLVSISFYLHNGYKITPNYGIYQQRPEAVCFKKIL